LRADPVKQHAAIYFKGHMTRTLKDAPSSSELFQLADTAISVLLSKNTQASLKLHVQDALTSLVKADNKATGNNVKVTQGLFEDFLSNRLKI